MKIGRDAFVLSRPFLQSKSDFWKKGGRHSSKRYKKLEERLRRVQSGDPSDEAEDAEEMANEGVSGIENTESGRSIESNPTQTSTGQPTYEQLKARVVELERAAVRGRSKGLEFRIGAKGGVSVYGLGRFPFTLYYEQWVHLLDAGERLRTFLEENRAAHSLKLKT